ncbi:MAG: FtsW/RodA/SpoVE family cell cycle protein [Oscillospiraceae bacterium]|nr:FtsW/RodA/SpoVE family cell cycle protein [Oscillospiraceae bacterium]
MQNASNAVPDGRRRKTANADNVRRKRITSDGTSRGYREKIATGPIDYPFLLIVMILLVMGIIMMFSAGYAWAIREEGGDGTAYVRNQMAMAGIGLVGMFFASFFDYHWFRKPIIAYGFYFMCVVLLVMCRVGPFKSPHHDSYRWVQFPGLPSFQPSELMKLAIIMLFAYLISVNYSKMKYFNYGIVPFLGFLGVVVALMMIQPHLSGTIIICSIGIIMMFVGGSRVKHLIILGLLGVAALAAALFILIEVKDFSYFEKRIMSWTDPFGAEASDATWQTKNSLIAIGSGGLFGLGLGNSRQKFLYLPEAKNDFVFAVVCEELGFIGALMVIFLFLLFICRGMYIASKAPDKYGMMLAVGLTVQIGLQALLNIAVVTNTIPNTGVSLPFFSYGGTALIMQLVQMGIILNISRQSIIET